MSLTRICLLFILCLTCFNCTARTLEQVRDRGYLVCGVSQSLPGFSFPNDDGQWSGLDVDICRAIAAAIFNDPTKVRFIPLSGKERFTALQSGEIDILSRNTTWTFTRDTQLGLEFTNITYYDGQGFLVNKRSGITSAKQLNGTTLCTNAGTTTELNAADYFRANDMQYKIISFEKDSEVVAAFGNGRCDAYTSDRSGLAAQRLKLRDPDSYIILPEVISKEPLGPLVRQDDPKWSDLVRWVVFGLVNAEEAGITQKNVKKMRKSEDPNVQRLLGIGHDLGKYIGVSQNFLVKVIESVGNYGEIYERNVGKDSLLKLPRDLNNLWTNGGLMYAPPYR